MIILYAGEVLCRSAVETVPSTFAHICAVMETLWQSVVVLDHAAVVLEAMTEAPINVVMALYDQRVVDTEHGLCTSILQLAAVHVN